MMTIVAIPMTAIEMLGRDLVDKIKNIPSAKLLISNSSLKIDWFYKDIIIRSGEVIIHGVFSDPETQKTRSKNIIALIMVTIKKILGKEYEVFLNENRSEVNTTENKVVSCKILDDEKKGYYRYVIGIKSNNSKNNNGIFTPFPPSQVILIKKGVERIVNWVNSPNH